jgi:hypothetical protein
MSALGQKQTYAPQKRMSALPPIATTKADISNGHVRFTPESGHVQCTSLCLLWANSGLMQRSKKDRYSITSSARASNVGDTVRPSALAVLRLIASSYLVGACTGRSAGFSPLRMRST